MRGVFANLHVLTFLYSLYFFPFSFAALTFLRSFNLNFSIEGSQPWVENNGLLYIGSLNTFVYALNYTTGAVMWSYDCVGPVTVTELIAFYFN